MRNEVRVTHGTPQRGRWRPTLRRLFALLLACVLAGCTTAAPPPPRPTSRATTAPANPAPAPATPAAAAPRLDIRLELEHREHVVRQARVSLRLDGLANGEPFEVAMPSVVDGEPGWPERVRDVVIRDEAGIVPVTRVTMKDEDDDDLVVWRAMRATRGPVSLDYVVDVKAGEGQSVTGTRSWPELGFEAVGATLLLLPRADLEWKVGLDWRGDVRGSSSIVGAGASVAATRGELAKAVFFAGASGLVSVDRDGQHLRGAWIGKLAFEVPELMGWIARVDREQRRFFFDTDDSPFTIYLVGTPSLSGSWIGSGQTRGFLLHAGEDLAWSRTLRFVLAHELVHRWVGMAGTGVRLDGPEGSAYWFTEGFTVHLTRALLLRDGLATAQEAVDDLNERTRRYFANPASGASNDVIAKRFWSSLDHQNLPYDRGMLYAAELDAALRTRSNGKRTVGGLVLELLSRERDEARRATPETTRSRLRGLPASAFREAVVKELGEPAGERFDAVILRGERPAPPSDAYGPCIRRKPKKIWQYDLGFALGSFAKKTIVDLRPDSAAARAGLKEGQRFLRAKGEIGKPDVPMRITIERDGKETVIEFSPKGAGVDGFAWERVPGAEERTCGRAP